MTPLNKGCVLPLVLVLGFTWIRTFILDGEVCVPASCVLIPVDSAPVSVSIALLDVAISLDLELAVKEAWQELS